MFVGLHFLYLWLPRWLWAEAILWWLEKSDSSIWGRSGGLLPPRGYPNYPCFVQISRQRHLCASSERSKTFGHCVLAQRYCCQKSSHTTLESYTLSVTCQVRTETIVWIKKLIVIWFYFIRFQFAYKPDPNQWAKIHDFS